VSRATTMPHYQPPSTSSEYYTTLAKEVYTAARNERWSSETVQDMLKNPQNFKKYLRRVSCIFTP
jgi:hypothetical protein